MNETRPGVIQEDSVSSCLDVLRQLFTCPVIKWEKVKRLLTIYTGDLSAKIANFGVNV